MELIIQNCKPSSVIETFYFLPSNVSTQRRFRNLSVWTFHLFNVTDSYQTLRYITTTFDSELRKWSVVDPESIILCMNMNQCWLLLNRGPVEIIDCFWRLISLLSTPLNECSEELLCQHLVFVQKQSVFILLFILLHLFNKALKNLQQTI